MASVLQWQPLSLLFVAASVTSLLAARVMWRRRHETPALATLLVTMLGLAQWSGVTALGMSVVGLTAQSVLLDAIYPGVCAAVAGIFCHARAMADRRWTWRWRREGLLLVEPVLVVLATVTNPWHHLFRGGYHLVGDTGALRSVPGPLFWAHTYYSYALLAVAAFVLLRSAVRSPRVHRRRFLWPVLGGLAPAVGNVVSVWLLPHGRSVDFTSICFLVTAGTFWWALQRSALPDVLPVAHGHVVETIDDAVLVVDRRYRIVQLNPAADALLRRTVPSAPPQLVGVELPGLTGALRLRFDENARAQRTFPVPAADLELDLRTTPLTDARGACIGWVLVARDVTEVRRRQQELERQQAELERQRAEAVAANEALREQLELVERLRVELAEQAVRDPLTGLFNRRRMVEVLEREVPATLAAGRPVSLLMMDVDRFKQVNDTHGHATGDAVLVAVARALAQGVGERELLARAGGEEFVVVLPGVGRAEALARAEALRVRCGQVEVTGAGGRAVRTTMSIGVAGLPGGMLPPDAAGRLLATADAALYAAKTAGRDRVVDGGVPSPVLPSPR
ncbi:histidine kinase N-terminal 7TM domain-containing protein [Kineococcus sp. NUM-3379]